MNNLLPLLVLVVAAPVQADELAVYPKTVHLVGPRDEQRLVVAVVKLPAVFASANPKIASVDANGIIRSVSDGETKITIAADGTTSTIPVKVEKSTADMPVSFNREIVPILTKFGCNSGACHGSQHGKGGFKLSLFGFDPVFDHAQIVQSAEGRRVVLSDAERSIVLRKPALMMEHGGGEKFKVGSREYRTLKAWLEDGAPEPDPKDPTVTKMEIFPPARVMTKGETQRLAVTAIWSDGRREDVTGTAQYDALNEAVASITPTGMVTAKASGETHMMVRFMGQAGVAQVTLPFKKIENYPKLLSNNYIDDLLAKQWKDLGLIPSPQVSDEEFLRRPYLDLIGTLPTPKEVEEFLKDEAGNKRSKLIDKLLERPEFVDFWALKWGDLLRINRDALQEKGMWSFHNWVRASLRDNKPVDEFVRDIITAEGSTFTDGPVNYYQVGRTADDWAETTSQVFLGVRMQCAKCHHHPFEKWSQDDYYGMSAFFSRLGTKNSPEFGLFGRESIIYIRNAGEVTHPRKRTVVNPHPLDGENMDDEFDRRKKLADWMTTKDNAFFAKNIVNRFWGYLMGRGLVEPMDDMRATNPAVNPELLDALAKDFAEHKFDLKHLLRTILSSRAYQASSTVTADNAIDTANTHFTRYSTKRLTAEQMADAIDFATGTREKYVGLPLGTRAIQLPDSRVRSYLLDVFGRPSRTIVCECERTMQPNIAQALHLLNGDFLNKKISDPAGRVEALMKAKADRKKAIEEMYLVTLSRLPKAEEVSKANSWIDSAKDGREGLQDLLWTLLNSKEFLFNH
jgi:Protein of unknown function (DUF1549)/Protein of unknown function (DUF1553)